jgi:hypothetical protein
MLSGVVNSEIGKISAIKSKYWEETLFIHTTLKFSDSTLYNI